jgi:hypothetical protein
MRASPAAGNLQVVLQDLLSSKRLYTLVTRLLEVRTVTFSGWLFTKMAFSVVRGPDSHLEPVESLFLSHVWYINVI